MQELLTRSQAAEEAENQASNPSPNPTMGEIIAARYSRRDLLRGGLAVTAISATVSPLALAVADKARADTNTPTFTFKEVSAGSDDRMHVAEGYDADVLIRWGDPVLPGAPPFDPENQTAAAQARQFGYNNDYLGYFPLDGSRRGLLVVNHEYTNEELMFPGLGRQDARDPKKQTVPFPKMTREIAEVEMMAHGGSVLEIARGANGKWSVVPDSRFARRITAETEMEITGPAAGVERMQNEPGPERAARARHAQQLRRRRHAVGHLADLRGERQRLLLRQARGASSGGAQLQAHGRPRQLAELGRLSRPLRHLEGAERGEPLRLGGGDRPLRPELRAEEAHGARALQARGRGRESSTRTGATSSIPATTSASTTSTSS